MVDIRTEEAVAKAYDQFYAYFTKSKDTPYAKYQMQMGTMFFDTAELYLILNELKGSPLNLEQKKAVARAALQDYLIDLAIVKYTEKITKANFDTFVVKEDVQETPKEVPTVKAKKTKKETVTNG